MPVVEPSKGEVPVIPDGTYDVTCLGVEDKYVEEDAFGKHDKLVFTLRLNDILDAEGNEIVFKPQINRAWGSDKANLYKYAIGFGVPCDLNLPINTDHFKGKKAQAFIFTEEEGKYPKITALIPAKKNGQSAPSGPVESRQPPEGDAVDADTVSAWFKARLGEGFDRKAILDLCAEMFEKRVPGELNAHELAGLTNQLNEST